MIQLIYASAATQPFTPEALKVLLTRARARNTRFGVSGMLLHHEGSFLQVLEGPEDGVETILASILRDPRHTTAKTLSREIIHQREFETWSMGFVDSANTVTQPTGFVDYHRTLPGLTDAGTRARRFLRFFQNGFYREADVA